jgi:nicotinamidase-related amidase
VTTAAGEEFWPRGGNFESSEVALLIIDMQVDFCAPGGWVDQLGEDVSNTRSVISPIRQALLTARMAGLTVIHTREGHRPDLSDLPANKQWRTRAHGLGIGDELAPMAGELVIDKPGKSPFHATDLEDQLRGRGIKRLVVTGVTSDCCVQSAIRDGFERGFECVLLADCTAAVETENHLATLEILSAFGGRWGGVSSLAAFQSMLRNHV